MNYRVVKDNKFDKYKDRPVEQFNYGEKYTGYKGVIWTPLDLPYLNIDLDKMWEVWQKQGQPWFDERPDDMNSARHTDFDKGKLKRVDDHDYRNLILLNAPGSYHSADIKGEWKDFVHDEFPEVVKWLEALPWENIRWCAFVGRDNHGVGPHYDEYRPLRHLLKPQEPSQVRVRWSNVTEWKHEHLYFTNNHGATRIYPMLPPETNSMAYDGTVYEHGADAGYHPKDRIQLMPMGTLNVSKWHEVLDKSIKKYKDYIITEDHFNATT